MNHKSQHSLNPVEPHLSAHDILNIWEKGQYQHDLERALTLLAAACPDKTPEKLAALSIGERDRHLIMLREKMLGQVFICFAVCPECHEHLEVTLSTKDILLPQGPVESHYEFRTGDFLVQYHLPDSFDLASITGCNDIPTARSDLGKRCITGVFKEGTEVSVDEIPENAFSGLSEQMARNDPQSELMLDLVCPGCEHKWQVLFDIVTFFWAEINSQAKRLLDEVHTIALVYGWSENDILSMSPARRQSYMDRVT